MKIFVYIYLIFTLFTFSQCKPKKQIAVQKRTEVENVVTKVEKKEEKKQNNRFIVDSVQKRYFRFKSIQMKTDLTIEMKDNSNSVSATIKMVKDSIIWISISPGLGVEVARAQMTKDSVVFIDRINSKYYAGNYQFFNKKFNLDVDFNLIQSILLNELFVYPKADDNKIENFNYQTDSTFYVLNQIYTNKAKNVSTTQRIDILRGNSKINSVSINDLITNRKLDVLYDEFETVEDVIFPKAMNINIKNNSNETKLSLEIKKISTENNLKFSIKIPESYTLIDF